MAAFAGDAMASTLTRAPHLPRLSRPGVLDSRPARSRRALGHPFPGLSAHPVIALALPAPAAFGWRRRALREGVIVTLLTSLMTSAVLAAPEAFRQSPAVSWRQFTAPTVTLDQSASGAMLLDCP
jgi:hypothetical protein